MQVASQTTTVASIIHYEPQKISICRTTRQNGVDVATVVQRIKKKLSSSAKLATSVFALMNVIVF